MPTNSLNSPPKHQSKKSGTLKFNKQQHQQLLKPLNERLKIHRELKVNVKLMVASRYSTMHDKTSKNNTRNH